MKKEEAEQKVKNLNKRANKNDLKLCPFTQDICKTGCAMWVKYFLAVNVHTHRCEVSGGYCVFTTIGG